MLHNTATAIRREKIEQNQLHFLMTLVCITIMRIRWIKAFVSRREVVWAGCFLLMFVWYWNDTGLRKIRVYWSLAIIAHDSYENGTQNIKTDYSINKGEHSINNYFEHAKELSGFEKRNGEENYVASVSSLCLFSGRQTRGRRTILIYTHLTMWVCNQFITSY